MKLNFKNLLFNFLVAFALATTITASFETAAIAAGTVTTLSAAVQYVFPLDFSGVMMALNKEVWVQGIKEKPMPDTSFVTQSTDMSEYVENNKLHLAEAGIDPGVHEDYFAGNETDLPTANINDTPSEVVLKTYSTEQTRHRDLQEIEYAYNKRESVIQRHRDALQKNLALRAAYAWTPSADGSGNKILTPGSSDSILDALIDLQAFYAGQDKTGELNIVLTPEHMARIRKEDKDLFKQIMNGDQMYGFNVFQYSKAPLFDDTNAKKPFGAVEEAGDKRASFAWASDEVFRCFGDVELYATLRDAGSQADNLSYAQRALLGVIRAANPKYLGAIIS